MIRDLGARLLDRASEPLTLVVALAVAVAVGVNVPGRPMVAVVAALLLLVLGVTLVDPLFLPTLAVPLVVVSMRVGDATTNLSLSDVALAAGVLPALVLVHRRFTPPMNWLVLLNVVYQFATLFAVAAHPFRANIVEWFHAWVLVGGALVVGWAVGRDGRARLALRLLAGAILLVAVGTVWTAVDQYLRRDFGPVYPTWPFPMHKNLAGPVLGLGAAIVYVRPSWAGWRPRTATALFVVFVVSALLTQSRQALIGLGVVLVLVVVNAPKEQRRSRSIFVVVLTLLALSVTMVQDQIASGDRFNSAYQRLSWFSDAVRIWSEDPWFGQGLRWWYQPERFGAVQPPNAELEVLTSVGLVGLVGFLVLFVGTILVLRRVPRDYAQLALVVVVSRLVQAQFDLFWVAVLGSIPWLVVGLCLGAQAWADEHDHDGAAAWSTSVAARARGPYGAHGSHRSAAHGSAPVGSAPGAAR